MRYLYQIAGIRVLCEIPFPIQTGAESADFFGSFPPESTADLKFIFRPTEVLEDVPPDGHWEINRYYIETEGVQRIYHCPIRELPPYARVTWPGGSGETVYCDYVRGMESYMNHSHNLCDLLGLETLLLKYDGLLLHSSFIRWRGEGFFFLRPPAQESLHRRICG